jgi:hypothetical protein
MKYPERRSIGDTSLAYLRLANLLARAYALVGTAGWFRHLFATIELTGGPRIVPTKAVSKMSKFRDFCPDNFWRFCPDWN